MILGSLMFVGTPQYSAAIFLKSPEEGASNFRSSRIYLIVDGTPIALGPVFAGIRSQDILEGGRPGFLSGKLVSGRYQISLRFSAGCRLGFSLNPFCN